MRERKRVAIIGSGCSGLGAAWGLKDSEYEVHIFEKSSRLGGHTNTQIWRHNHHSVPVDTGFITMNTATYPNFLRFLREVGVETVPTEMTFGVSRDHGEFEWSGEAQGIFAQSQNFFNLRHWRMIFDIVRFNQFALDLLASDDDEDGIERPGSSVKRRRSTCDMSIGEYLNKEGYSHAFRENYLIPMTAAVWSTSPDKASLEFPAQTLVRFMWNHHLLSTFAERPPWLTIPGGSQKYIDAIISSFPSQRLNVHTSCTVTGILRTSHQADGVKVQWVNSENECIVSDSFHHVIFACHGDEVLPILTEDQNRPGKGLSNGSHLRTAPKEDNSNGCAKSWTVSQEVSQEEREIFSSFQTTSNVCYLHSDVSLMPKRRKVWTSWNYLVNSNPSSSKTPAGVSLTYCMNILQHLSEDTFGPVLVTMNPDHEPLPELTQGKFAYSHPLYTAQSVKAQKRLESIQNKNGVSYCGAWTKYGFHEDGFSSGLRVAVEHLGAKLPFEFIDSTYSRGHKPDLGWKDHLLRTALMITLICMRSLGRIWQLPGVSLMVVTALTFFRMFISKDCPC